MFAQRSRWHTTSKLQSWHISGLQHTVLCASLMVGWNAERWRAATLPNNSSGAACPGAFAPPPRAFATKSAVCAACFSAFSFKYWSGKRAAEGVERCDRFLILDFKSDTRNLSQLRNHPFRHKGKPLEHLRNLAMLINKRHSTPTLESYIRTSQYQGPLGSP